jgi:hypothetical protein
VKNTSGQYKKEKKQILNSLDALDKKAESTPLDPNELTLKCFLNNILTVLLREEEMKWYQRAKVKELLEGDSNTKYFQLLANSKYRTTKFFQFQHKVDNRRRCRLKQHITKYYKNIFWAI